MAAPMSRILFTEDRGARGGHASGNSCHRNRSVVNCHPMRIRVWHSGWVVILVALMLTLTGLAYASPPDPSWIAGLYDDDFDNVVDYITSTSHFVFVAVPTDLRPVHDLIVLPVQPDVDIVAVIPLAAFGPRAPPIV